MRRFLLTLVLLLVAGAFLPASATQVDNWTGQYPLAAGGRVSVDNVQGSIWVEAWDRAEVELTIVKTAGDTATSLNDVDVAIQPGRDWLRVQTLYPCSSEEAVVVDYRLRVPRQVQLEGLHTVNGSITVRGVEGSVEARTFNGDIEQTDIAGSVNARTLNGGVRVALRALPETSGALQLESINGDVQLLVPADANADLSLSTVAGRIQCHLPFTTGAGGGENTARARMGRGGLPVRLRTVRGNIRVAEAEGVL